MAWKKLSSQIVFDNFMKIEEQIFEMPDGQIKKFYVKVTPPAACVLALTSDNKVITVKQYRPGPDKTVFDLPGGYIDEGEDPRTAVARELREETGYEGDVEFVTECLDDAYNTMIRSCFVATNCKKVSEQTLDDSEFIDVHLVDLPNFVAMTRSGVLTDVEVAFLGLDHLGLLPPKSVL